MCQPSDSASIMLASERNAERTGILFAGLVYPKIYLIFCFFGSSRLVGKVIWLRPETLWACKCHIRDRAITPSIQEPPMYKNDSKRPLRANFEMLERRIYMAGDTLPADLNCNGTVDFSDFLILSRNFGNDAATQAQGDMDGNGKVEFADFLVFADDFGKTTRQTELTWGKDDTPPSNEWTKPELLTAYTDPVYGTSVRRLTDATGTRFDRNTYSRRQAENADGTLLMTYHGSASYHIYNRETGALVRALDIHPDAEPQWHPTNADLVSHLTGKNSSNGSLTLQQTNVQTGETTTIVDLTSRLQDVWPTALYMLDRAEGSPSMDGSNYAWIVYDAAEDPLGIVSYSIQDDSILGTTAIDDSAGPLDWISASATGKYVVAGHWEGTIVYDADLTNPRFMNRKGDHSDLALDANGNDAYVYVDFGGTSETAGWIVSVDMETLERTRMVELYGGANTSVHISGKGYNKPGWVIVSSYNCKNPGAWSCEKVFALEIAEEGRLLNLANTYNAGEDYWTETHAVVNRDFTRVYFNSDGGSGGIDAEVYELTLPEFE